MLLSRRQGAKKVYLPCYLFGQKGDEIKYSCVFFSLSFLKKDKSEINESGYLEKVKGIGVRLLWK